MNIKEIQQLIKFVAKSGVSEVKIESKDLKLSVKTGVSGNVVSHTEQVLVNAQPLVQSLPSETHSEPEKTPASFYRKPSPDKPNFIEIGDSIKEGSVLCVVEAMKLFNEIESEYSGKIVKILVDDATPVEFDQPLFVVDPS